MTILCGYGRVVGASIEDCRQGTRFGSDYITFSFQEISLIWIFLFLSSRDAQMHPGPKSAASSEMAKPGFRTFGEQFTPGVSGILYMIPDCHTNMPSIQEKAETIRVVSIFIIVTESRSRPYLANGMPARRYCSEKSELKQRRIALTEYSSFRNWRNVCVAVWKQEQLLSSLRLWSRYYWSVDTRAGVEHWPLPKK